MSAPQVTTQIRAVPGLIEASLTALRNPNVATQETHNAAVAKLENYETALEIASRSSATFTQRIAAVTYAAEKIAQEALPPAGLYQENLTGRGLEVVISQLTSVNEKLTRLLSILNDEALATLRQTMMSPGSSALIENHPGSLVSQRTYLFSVAPCEGTIGDELTILLGERAAGQLVETWRNRSLLDLSLETGAEIAMFSGSNNMASNEYYDEPGERITQEEHLQSAG